MADSLDDLLAEMPLPEASEGEISAFMERVMSAPGGAELVRGFAEKITAGGTLDVMLKEKEREEEKRSLKSPVRFILRIELMGTSPLVWRRLSLPADCAYFHLGKAIQAAFEWEGVRGDRFEVWEDGELELSFGSAESGGEYCHIENHLMDLFQENVSEFRYFCGLEGEKGHRVVIEDFVPAGVKGTCDSLTPHFHAGEGQWDAVDH